MIFPISFDDTELTFNGVQIRRIGWEVKQFCAGGVDKRLGFLGFMEGCIIQNNDVIRSKRWA